jgi:hypothetical protein
MKQRPHAAFLNRLRAFVLNHIFDDESDCIGLCQTDSSRSPFTSKT